MRRFSFSAVVFALALVLQAAATAVPHGAGLALKAGEAVAAAHCAQHDGAGSSSEVPGEGHKHECFSCAACFSGASPLVARAIYVHAGRSVFAVARFAAVAPLEPPSAKARAHQARAPPPLS